MRIKAAVFSATLVTLLAASTHVATAQAPARANVTQSVAVEGALTSGGSAAPGTTVRLYDRESLQDDLLDERTTDAAGAFRAEGSVTKFTKMKPYIQIRTKVGLTNPICFRSIKIDVPDSAVTTGSSAPNTTYDVGALDLDQPFPGEAVDCS